MFTKGIEMTVFPKIWRIVIFLLLILFAMPTFADDTGLSGFNVQHFRLANDRGGILSVHGSETLGHLKPFFHFDTNYSKGLITAGNPVNNELVNLIDNLVTSDISFSVGMTSRMNFGVSVPVNFYVSGTDVSQTAFKAVEVGDVGFEGKVRFINESIIIPGMAIYSRLTVPTGDKAYFLSDGSATGEFRAIVDKHIGDFHGAANFGYKIIDKHQVQNMRTGLVWNVTNASRLTFGAGLRYSLPWQRKTWDLSAQVVGESVVTNFSKLTTPVEFHFGAGKEIQQGFKFLVGGGRGITNAIGSPNIRLFAALGMDLSVPKRQSARKGKAIQRDEAAKSAIEETHRQVHVAYFRFDKAALSHEQKELLISVLKSIKETPPKRIVIRGHTDIWGPDAYNEKLSRARALTIKKIIQVNGFNDSIITVEAYGSTQTVVPPDDLKNQRLNRRAEILVE